MMGQIRIVNFSKSHLASFDAEPHDGRRLCDVLPLSAVEKQQFLTTLGVIFYFSEKLVGPSTKILFFLVIFLFQPFFFGGNI